MGHIIRTSARFGRRGLLLAAGALVLAGCSSHRAYDTAFSTKTALSDNSHEYSAPAGEVINAVKVSLVQQGFEIEQLDTAGGLLKGMRTFDDPKNPKIAYLVTLTAAVTVSSPQSSMLTAAATQKTVLNREIHKYYHLLGLLPIPTGREYQSVVRAEGNITGAAFYRDLFAAVSRNLAALRKGGEAAPRSGSPAPLLSGAEADPAHAPVGSSGPRP
jgi:hypothetical protein